MEEIKNIIVGIIAVFIIFCIGVIVGYKYFSTTEIEVKEKKIYETKWKTEIKTKIVYKEKKPEFNQENFGIFYNCYISPIQFEDWTEKNYLNIKAFDDCKEAQARYEIGQKGNWKIYLGFGLGGFALGTGLYFIFK